MTHLRRHLAEHRLVTMIGPGGVGKTALAREASRELGASHPLGAPFVDLAPIDVPGEVPGAKPALLGFPEL